ncbi:MAG TPA: hypothetical protein VIK18_16945 [Pirellulales bacterium]
MAQLLERICQVVQPVAVRGFDLQQSLVDRDSFGRPPLLAQRVAQYEQGMSIIRHTMQSSHEAFFSHVRMPCSEFRQGPLVEVGRVHRHKFVCSRPHDQDNDSSGGTEVNGTGKSPTA